MPLIWAPKILLEIPFSSLILQLTLLFINQNLILSSISYIKINRQAANTYKILAFFMKREKNIPKLEITKTRIFV